MFDTIFGLPVHVLVNHAVVLGIPVAALITAAVTARASWRERWVGWVVLLNAAMLVTTFVTRQSGSELYNRIEQFGVADAERDHRQLGLFLIWPMLLLLVLSVLVWVAVRQASSSMVSVALTVATVVAAGVAIYYVIRTGDSGARAVWRETVKNT